MRSLEQAGAGLEKLVAHSLQQATPSQSALLAWPVVCGSAVADRTRALDFQDGVLRVEVADAGWKSELQVLAPRYLAAINRYTRLSVRRIEFVAIRTTPKHVNLHSSTGS
jgi:Dna[CI] antecedent, DciA